MRYDVVGVALMAMLAVVVAWWLTRRGTGRRPPA